MEGHGGTKQHQGKRKTSLLGSFQLLDEGKDGEEDEDVQNNFQHI